MIHLKIKLKNTIYDFSSDTEARNQNKKEEKELSLASVKELLNGRQMFLNAFKMGIFQ